MDMDLIEPVKAWGVFGRVISQRDFSYICNCLSDFSVLYLFTAMSHNNVNQLFQSCLYIEFIVVR